jgi:hypothetical protein
VREPSTGSQTLNLETHANAGYKDKKIAIEILRAEFAAQQTGPRAFLGIDIIEEAMRDGAEESGPAMIAREFWIQVHQVYQGDEVRRGGGQPASLILNPKPWILSAGAKLLYMLGETKPLTLNPEP